MRLFLTLALLLSFKSSFEQNFTYPTITQKGQSFKDFVPAGWIIIDSAFGDLNKDFLDDYALVLQHTDSVKMVEAESDDKDTILAQPRVLLILFKNSSGDSLYLAEQSNSFILVHDDPQMDDPYQSIKIERHVLQIEFNLFYYSGSWYVNNAIYKFRYESNQFTLIGAEYSSFHRATHDFEQYSYNFLVKKRSLTKGNDNTGIQNTKWKSLNIKTLKTLKTFLKPFTWEVEKDIYL